MITQIEGRMRHVDPTVSPKDTLMYQEETTRAYLNSLGIRPLLEVLPDVPYMDHETLPLSYQRVLLKCLEWGSYSPSMDTDERLRLSNNRNTRNKLISKGLLEFSHKEKPLGQERNVSYHRLTSDGILVAEDLKMNIEDDPIG